MHVSPHLRLIFDQAQTGAHQMAVDELLFRNQIKIASPSAILRFYQFAEPTFTVGYGMWGKVSASLNAQIPAIRRITGGGIVHHKPSDLTYALIISLDDQKHLKPVKESYRLIHEALQNAFRDFGHKAFLKDKCCDSTSEAIKNNSSFCFEAPVLYDVMLGGQKIAGAGQKRTLGYLLHQGSIDWNRMKLVAPELQASDLLKQFSLHLSQLLHLEIKEIPFSIEETKQTFQLIAV